MNVLTRRTLLGTWWAVPVQMYLGATQLRLYGAFTSLLEPKSRPLHIANCEKQV